MNPASVLTYGQISLFANIRIKEKKTVSGDTADFATWISTSRVVVVDVVVVDVVVVIVVVVVVVVVFFVIIVVKNDNDEDDVDGHEDEA